MIKDREKDEQLIGRANMSYQKPNDWNRFSSSAEEFLKNNELAAFIQNQVFSPILKKKHELGEKELRIWIAGCSTGQEVYSLAILLKEHINSSNHEPDFNFKIYATDLDYDFVKIAGAGVYPEYAFDNVEQTLLHRYFERKDEFFVVKKDIRKHIIFAPHNIAKDPGFQNLDYISCRNVLNYFQAGQQQKIISSFYQALNVEGYLCLGPNGNIGDFAEQFKSVNQKWKIFKKQEAPVRNSSKNAGLHAIKARDAKEAEMESLRITIEQSHERIKELQQELERVHMDYNRKYDSFKIDSYHPILFVKGLLQLMKKEEFYKTEYAHAMFSEMSKLEEVIDGFLKEEHK